MRSSLLALIALTTGCSSVDGAVALDGFGDCDAFRGHMARMARDELTWRYRRGISFPARNEMGLSGADDMAESAGDAEPPMDGEAGADSYSTTNTQEGGVDEADIVKTDGEYLYALSGQHVVITRAWPLQSAAMLAKVQVDGTPQGLYLADDLVVVLSNLWWEQPRPRAGAPSAWEGGSGTVITVIDVADPQNPVVLREAYTNGELKESRRIGSKVLVVTYTDVDPTAGANNAREARAIVHDADPSAWLPVRLDNTLTGDAWTTASEPACDCEDVYAAEIESGTFLTTVHTLDLADPTAPLRGSAVVGRSDLVYASKQALYVAYSSWNEGPFAWDGAPETVFHKFDFGEQGPVYASSGRAPGTLPDQFGLSEKDDVLRVATTDSSDWTSGVYTFEDPGDGRLVELGRVEGLAPGETLMSARFAGDMGYLVTYEVQWGDPLFTIDLSDPQRPEVGGELHVSGWSDYLHPMDAGHLLAVGMDQEAGGAWKLAVSLFDVTDITDPKLADRELLQAWGSEAQAEHHAFNWFAPTKTLTIPSWADSGHTVLEVLAADPSGLAPVGRVAQDSGLFAGADPSCGGVRRSVVMEDAVWAISGVGMTAAPLAAPTEALAEVAFTGTDPCYGRGYDW